MNSKIKSFENWLYDELGEDYSNPLGFEENTIKMMRFTYDSAVAETLKFVMERVVGNEENNL